MTGLALLAAALGLAVALAQGSRLGAVGSDQTKPSPLSNQSGKGKADSDAVGSRRTVLPKPTPGARKELAAAFSKPGPSSMADLKSMEQHLKALAARVSPAVVAVEVDSGSGSGVVISWNGLVLSAGHVCRSPGRNVTFTFPDGKTARGKTLGVDRESDTGLMRITDPGAWPHVPTGELESAHLGDWVLALGHPGGFDLKRSLVIRFGRIIRLTPDTLQTDCTISPGDSGGPLLDMHGRVIGIHSYISGSTTENFHVPISEFYDGWESLAGARIEALPTEP
jgi:serine protease Do